MDVISIILFIIGILTIIFIFGWIVKSYFNLNKDQATQHDDQLIDSINLNISDDTITESNNELSKHAFDGINQNPEHPDRKKINDNINNNKTPPDMANESSFNQSYTKKVPK